MNLYFIFLHIHDNCNIGNRGIIFQEEITTKLSDKNENFIIAKLLWIINHPNEKIINGN